jgi:hypothetical protein
MQTGTAVSRPCLPIPLLPTQTIWFYGRVILQFSPVKDCHCERSEAISKLRGLLRRFTPRNDKLTPYVINS